MSIRSCRRRQKVDPSYYIGYCSDKQSIEEIEHQFALLEAKQKENPTVSTFEAAKAVFKVFATPEQIPYDAWMALGEESFTGEFDDDDCFAPAYGDFDEDGFPRKGQRLGMKPNRKGKGTAGQTSMANVTQVEHLGAGVDLWPFYKVRQVRAQAGVMVHKDFPNCIQFKSREQFIREISESSYHLVDNINVNTFKKIVGDQCDAIIMDVPFGQNGWDYTKLYNWLCQLKPHLDRCFIVSWASPDDLDGIVEAFRRADFKFCDSMAVELLDTFERPYVVKDDEHRWPRDSRMAVMFRTQDIARNDLKQQRVKDTGFGIVAEGAKTYGRTSMPMTIHNIIEIMLPPRRNSQRVFVELWPSFFHRSKGWILIDELPNDTPYVRPEPVAYDPRAQFE